MCTGTPAVNGDCVCVNVAMWVFCTTYASKRSCGVAVAGAARETVSEGGAAAHRGGAHLFQ